MKRWLGLAKGIAGRAAVVLAFVAGITVLLFGLAGAYMPKVSMQVQGNSARDDKPPGVLAEVRLIRLPLVETAVGTVRPVSVSTVGARLLARAVEVNLKAGQAVNRGDILVRLDDVDLRARLRQAEAVLHAAEAARNQADADAHRAAILAKSNAITPQDNERAATALKAADAELDRAKESINEIEATLNWATVRSPIQGIVIDKKIDAGDMASPGQVLATLFDPKRMQLVASVRESHALRLKVGQPIDVQIEELNLVRTGAISEIVPEAESSSRTFQVKVIGPCPEGIYSGMFGRILIPLGDEQILVIPRHAVQCIGQLDLVDVATPGALGRRAVRLGRTVGEYVEVLSGLREGESVLVPVATTTTVATKGANRG
jgi:RND family efflux transporter MFP subunit